MIAAEAANEPLFLQTNTLLVDGEQVSDRQDRLPGYDQSALANAQVDMVGCGGIGGENAEALVHMGVGTLQLFDHDIVEASNLNRQYFTPADIGSYKAHALARNVAPYGAMGTKIIAHNMMFEDVIIDHKAPATVGDIVLCGVDSDQSRVDISQWCLINKVPFISVAVDKTATYGMCFVQPVGGACFNCLYPDAGKQVPVDPQNCIPVGATKTPLKLVAALAVRAVESLLMNRPIHWNFREVNLANHDLDKQATVRVRPDCPGCSTLREGGSA